MQIGKIRARVSTSYLARSEKNLTGYGNSACYKISANASWVKIAGTFINDVISNPQKTISKQSTEIALPASGADGR
jgi:hypothetical protein